MRADRPCGAAGRGCRARPRPNASVERRPSAAIVTRARSSPSNGRPLALHAADARRSSTSARRTVHRRLELRAGRDRIAAAASSRDDGAAARGPTMPSLIARLDDDAALAGHAHAGDRQPARVDPDAIFEAAQAAPACRDSPCRRTACRAETRCDRRCARARPARASTVARDRSRRARRPQSSTSIITSGHLWSFGHLVIGSILINRSISKR